METRILRASCDAIRRGGLLAAAAATAWALHLATAPDPSGARPRVSRSPRPFTLPKNPSGGAAGAATLPAITLRVLAPDATLLQVLDGLQRALRLDRAAARMLAESVLASRPDFGPRERACVLDLLPPTP
jgi:hypothetical protein